MGLDLTLLPFDSDLQGNSYSHSVLSCASTYDLFDEIEKIAKKSEQQAIQYLKEITNDVTFLKGIVPKDFTSYVSTGPEYEEPHYGVTTKTPYGKPLQYVSVNLLLKLKDHPQVKYNKKNKAVWAYLECLPPLTKVALYWH